MNAGSPAGDRFDLIVIGAGINGAGIARDASLRGLRVLLIDKGDVGSGTTSWSTRLIHGGLRYLEHGEVGLVWESLRERERLLRIAPHLVRPLPLLIPIYVGDKRGPALIRVGMLAYDALSLGKSTPGHQMLDDEAVRQRVPGLRNDGLRGAALYYDGQAEYPERLTLENALDARLHGTELRTYCEVERILTVGPNVNGIEGHDTLSGEPFRFYAPIIINVAGPWVDTVLNRSAPPIAERLIGGTKGTHIVVGPFPGAPRDGIYAESRRDGRPFFIIPWNDVYLIGTTDTLYAGSLDRVVAEPWEIDWLLDETNRIIPSAMLRQENVFYSYAGVRPLPFVPNGREGSITRRHRVLDHGLRGGPAGLLSVIGGKLTTYRELAEQAVDMVLRMTGRPKQLSRTADVPLPGGEIEKSWDAFQRAFGQESALSDLTNRHLLRVYGSCARQLLATAVTTESRAVIDADSGAIAAEIPWAFQMEGARTLADAIARRTMIGLGPRAGIGADRVAADVARHALGWDSAKAEAEVAAYRDWVSRYRPRALEETSSASDA